VALDLSGTMALKRRIREQPASEVAAVLARMVQRRLEVGRAVGSVRRGEAVVEVSPRFDRPTLRLTRDEIEAAKRIIARKIAGR